MELRYIVNCILIHRPLYIVFYFGILALLRQTDVVALCTYRKSFAPFHEHPSRTKHFENNLISQHQMKTFNIIRSKEWNKK